MNNNNSSIGWILAIIAFIVLLIGISFSSTPKTDSKSSQPAYSTTKATTTTTTTKAVNTEPTKQEPQPITWHCVDATSYNKNPYDDNRCTSSAGEVRYVSDSQARALDPSYTPGTSGHPYYNSK